MNALRTAIATGLVLTLGFGAALAAETADKKAPPPEKPRHVDLAVLLDTSNSMDGLIDAARMKLWDIVNTLATAKPRPAFRVALYEYGNTNLDGQTGWVRQVCDLTDDLDTVYKELMALKTRGGTEYVARVVDRAARDLKWSAEKDALKIIFVAGNEAATQDPTIKHTDAAKTAIGAGIIVNTIFCGDHQQGIRTGWQEVALASDGKYASINQNETFAVATPFDKRLVELNAELNKTYVAYGARGEAGRENQIAQDANAAKLGAPAAAQRAAAKGGVLYTNSTWDLVDRSRDKDFKLEDIKEADLPEEMKKMTPEQRKAQLEGMTKKREAVQAEIKKLADQQRAYIDQERRKQSEKSGKSLDTALLGALTEQAKAKGFTFESSTTQPDEK